jgi:hypothetical protein
MRSMVTGPASAWPRRRRENEVSWQVAQARALSSMRGTLVEKQRSHLATVKAQHDADLALGAGTVVLPEALARKYPSAPREWNWQWVFPATRTYLATGEVRRHHLHETLIQRAVRKAAIAAGITKPVTPTPCGIPSLPTCWKTATTSAPSKSCSAIAM